MPTPTTPTPSWLDIMPAIPLDHGVHVRTSDGSLGIVLAVDDLDRTAWVQYAPPNGAIASNGEWRWLSALRVDIDRAQGFAYALRMVYPASGGMLSSLAGVRPLTVWAVVAERWATGNTTDADRLALATALAEVSR